jgi:hypothetical protein
MQWGNYNEGFLTSDERDIISSMTKFHLIVPTLENYYRGIILFGDNTATYKFALGKSLLELATNSSDLVTMEELAEPFSAHLVEHISHSPKQITRSDRGGFLNVCDKYNRGEATKDELIACTVKNGFKDVIKAFHKINGKDIETPFYVDERKTNKGIRLTDELRQLVLEHDGTDLTPEIESRWRLVETAWSLRLSRNVVAVCHDAENEKLIVNQNNRRKGVTSSRNALNGYQRGRCFFCYEKISVRQNHPNVCHVDHFFPYSLRRQGIIEEIINGVWNLVLSCSTCNGSGEKGAKVPSPTLVERLNRRNEYLIESNHPLKETIILQTGKTKQARIGFIQGIFDTARVSLVNVWYPEAKGDPTF